MAQLPCIGLYKPCINLPFGDCAMYFEHGVYTLVFQMPLEVWCFWGTFLGSKFLQKQGVWKPRDIENGGMLVVKSCQII